jgi:hypothetical protein
VLTFGPGIDDINLTQALRGAGVACAPLSHYFDIDTVAPMHGLVCGYSRLPETQAAGAVAIIRDVLGPGLTHIAGGSSHLDHGQTGSGSGIHGGKGMTRAVEPYDRADQLLRAEHS